MQVKRLQRRLLQTPNRTPQHQNRLLRTSPQHPTQKKRRRRNPETRQSQRQAATSLSTRKSEAAVLLSMTGHGEASGQNERISVRIEIRSVNNRHLKVGVPVFGCLPCSGIQSRTFGSPDDFPRDALDCSIRQAPRIPRGAHHRSSGGARVLESGATTRGIGRGGSASGFDSPCSLSPESSRNETSRPLRNRTGR